MLKRDEHLSSPPMLMSEFLVSRMSRISNLSFAHFFDVKPILVPTPNSSLAKPGTLWVPRRLAAAMVRHGLGQSVVECLKRVKPLRKAATSTSSDRPTAAEHYESMEIQKGLSEPREILLVDDVVTRGATLIGAANRLAEAFPDSRIRAFAAIRTTSSPSEFRGIVDPRVGTIQLSGSQTIRSP